MKIMCVFLYIKRTALINFEFWFWGVGSGVPNINVVESKRKQKYTYYQAKKNKFNENWQMIFPYIEFLLYIFDARDHFHFCKLNFFMEYFIISNPYSI